MTYEIDTGNGYWFRDLDGKTYESLGEALAALNGLGVHFGEQFVAIEGDDGSEWKVYENQDDADAGGRVLARILRARTTEPHDPPAPPPISDEQIEALRVEAAQAGDVDQVFVCNAALSGAQWDERTGMSATEARTECWRVIQETKAQLWDASGNADEWS